ncbi:hypothetical protein ACQ4PT_021032 [Festuca glaucescens]
MDMLADMFRVAEVAGPLESLSAVGVKHQVSLYADDVVVFARPDARELGAVRAILECFDAALGLRINFAKSATAPIRCSEEVIQAVALALSCKVVDFPCSYLGLPLSPTRFHKRDLQLVLDKIANKLAHWKRRLLTRKGHVAYVQIVMTASVIYQLLALDLEPWFLHAVYKLHRGFLWVGKEDVRGGSCLVVWHQVCQSRNLGGLGLHNLKVLNAALRSKWIWFSKTDFERPWHGMNFKIMCDATCLFNAWVKITVGDGTHTLFWDDPWIDGLSVATIAPAILALVKPRFR